MSSWSDRLTPEERALMREWYGQPLHEAPYKKITIPGFGTLTRRGESVLVLLVVIAFVGLLALAGWVEHR